MISKTAEYALRAVVWLARQPGQAESADRLAEFTCIPRRYLPKVLQDLVRATILRSQAGPRGGYALAAQSKSLTILDVVNAVAPLERIRHCPLGLSGHTSLCPLHRELDAAYATAEQAFARVSIAQLAGTTPTPSPLCQVPVTLPPARGS